METIEDKCTLNIFVHRKQKKKTKHAKPLSLALPPDKETSSFPVELILTWLNEKDGSPVFSPRIDKVPPRGPKVGLHIKKIYCFPSLPSRLLETDVTSFPASR
jgi:hypothetical protein